MDALLELFMKRLEVRTAKAILDYHRLIERPDYASSDEWSYDVGYLRGDMNGLCIALREFDDMVSEIDPKNRRYALTSFDKAWAEDRLAQDLKEKT